MAAESKSSGIGSIPWQLIVAVAVAGGGALLLAPLLSSSRPDASAGNSKLNYGYQDVDARLWQDPFAAIDDYAETEKSTHTQDIKLKLTLPPNVQTPAIPQAIEGSVSDRAGEDEPTRRTSIHLIDSLEKQITNRLKLSKKVQVLAVMVSGAPYAENAEDRLRLRYAVVAALGVPKPETNGRWEPHDNTHIGYVEVPWTPKPDKKYAVPAPQPAEPEAPIQLKIPYEWYNGSNEHPKDSADSANEKKPDVLVLWLREDAFLYRPFARLSFLASQLQLNRDKDKVSFSLIGPRTSDGLRAMVEDAERRNDRKVERVEQAKATPKTTLISRILGIFRVPPRQTKSGTSPAAPAAHVEPKAEEKKPTTIHIYSAMATIADEVLVHTKGDTVANVIENALKDGELNCDFKRTVQTDDAVMNAMVTELQSRQVTFAPKLIHIAIVSEFDTAYGRAIPYAFDKAQPAGSGATLKLWYLRGLDGKLPGKGAGKHSEPPPTQKDSKSSTWTREPPEPPEGVSQGDYLLRMGDIIDAQNDYLVRETGVGFKAIGVMGSDQYDKLMVLQALRPRFPAAIFFTTNLDARMGYAPEWKETHNLLIASSFGLRLSPTYQAVTPAFRDSSQTAVFCATLQVLDVIKTPKLGSARLFEVGRSGPYDLSSNPPAALDGTVDNSYVQPPRSDAIGWWTSAWRWKWVGALFVALVALGVYTVWRLREWGYFAFSSSSGHQFIKQFFDIWEIPLFVLAVLAGLLILLLNALQNWNGSGEGEPMLWAEGISIWPTEFLRLIAGFWAAYLIFKARWDAKENRKVVVEDFGLEGGTGTVWPGSVDVQTLWKKHQISGSWARYGWILISVAIFYCLSLLVFQIWGSPTTPGRGNFSFYTDSFISHLITLPILFLIFLMLDSTFINYQFINALSAAQASTQWPNKEKVDELFRAQGIMHRSYELREFLTIRLIAAATRVTQLLLFYPFLIIFILLVSRTSYFDNWDWPVGYLVVMGFLVGSIMAALVILLKAADKARKNAIRSLRERFLGKLSTKGKGSGARKEAYRRTIAAIRKENQGVFSFLARHPAITAILLPSGGLGIWAILEYFAKPS